MKGFRRKSWLLVCALSALSFGSGADAAQKRKAGAKTGVVPRKVVKPPLSPTQLLVGQLVLNSMSGGDTMLDVCARSNLRGLLWAFEGKQDDLDVEKGEFESTLQFEERQEKIQSAINGVGETVICSPPNDEVSLKYDADKQNFELSFDDDLILAHDFKRTGSYASSTRMGARAIVTSYLSINYRVDMTKSLNRTSTGCIARNAYAPNKLYFFVPLSDAPGVKQNSVVAIAGKIISPFFDKTERSGEPTIDHPSDIYSINMRLKYQPRVLVVFGPKRNEVARCEF